MIDLAIVGRLIGWNNKSKFTYKREFVGGSFHLVVVVVVCL